MPTRIIISGTVDFPPENVAPALAAGKPLIEGALTEEGCLDYDWCPDPLNPGRVRVFERWASEEALAAHFKAHWYNRNAARRSGSLAFWAPTRPSTGWTWRNRCTTKP